ncbi:MAG: hypothetical protein IH592_15710 [Bacteroidales bacterium]|nr:hypothetical protein [Bacteroidales bacterium]
MKPGGLLASTAGRIIGTGEGLGIGLMFVLSGLLIIVTASVIIGNQSLKSLETE